MALIYTFTALIINIGVIAFSPIHNLRRKQLITSTKTSLQDKQNVEQHKEIVEVPLKNSNKDKSSFAAKIIPFISYCIGKKNESYAYPPYAPHGPIKILKMISNGESVLFVVQATKNVGTVFRLRLAFPGPMTVVLGDIDAARTILCDRRSKKTPSVYNMLLKVHGGSRDVFVSEGPHWVHARKCMSFAFSSHNIRRMNRVVLERTDEYVTKRLRYLAETETPFDISHEMLHLILSVISESSFQYEMDVEERELFLTEINIFFQGLTMNPLRDVFARIIPNPVVKRASLAPVRLMKIARKILENYKSLKSPIDGTAIDLIVKNKSYKNDEERASDILVLLIGGHDTTAYSIAWTLFELAKNRAEHKKLRSELQKQSPENHHEVKQLQYVIKEGLRLHPVTGGMGPCRTIEDDVIVKGKTDIIIPKGSRVFCSAYLLFRNEKYYENPTEYRPSRWENPSEEAKNAFIPFLIGRRNCVGQSLANASLHTIMARLCVEYDFTIVNEGKGVAFFTYKPEKLMLIAKRAEDKSREVSPMHSSNKNSSGDDFPKEV